MKTVPIDTIQDSSYSKTTSVCSPLRQTHTCYSILSKRLKNINKVFPTLDSSPHMLCEQRTLNHHPSRHGYKNTLPKNKDTYLHNAPANPSKGSPVWDWERNCLARVTLSPFTTDGDPRHVPQDQLLHATLTHLSSAPFYRAHPLPVTEKITSSLNTANAWRGSGVLK